MRAFLVGVVAMAILAIGTGFLLGELGSRTVEQSPESVRL